MVSLKGGRLSVGVIGDDQMSAGEGGERVEMTAERERERLQVIGCR